MGIDRHRLAGATPQKDQYVNNRVEVINSYLFEPDLWDLVILVMGFFACEETRTTSP